MKYQIKHRFTGAVLFETEAESLPAHVAEAVERIRDAFDVDANGCWLWRHGLTHGHARITIKAKRYYVHRLLCELANGPIPSDRLACHSCGVSRCINPAHVYVGTEADNSRDAIRHGQTTRGRRLTVEHREKVAAAMRGRIKPAAVRQRIAASVRAFHSALRDLREQAALQEAS